MEIELETKLKEFAEWVERLEAQQKRHERLITLALEKRREV